MLLTAALAAIVLAPAVFADVVTSSAVRCTTSYGYEPLPSGTTVTTWLNKTTTTNYITHTQTIHETVTVTPPANISTEVVTTTTVFEVTSTSTPIPTTVPTPAGFLPLFNINPTPTAISRAKRFDVAGSDYDMSLAIFKRQTLQNYTGGFSVSRNGSTSNIFRKYPHRVDCKITYTVNDTTTSTVTGVPETISAAGPTAVVLSTTTITSTTTVTEIAPRPTKYAACLENNVVNSVPGFTGEEIVFNRVIYRPSQGFPLENELITNATTGEACCIACQNTPFCAGSFFVPSERNCHLRLTQAPTPQVPTIPSRPIPPYSFGNSTAGGRYPTNPTASGAMYPTGTGAVTAPTGVVATGTSPAVPISTAGPGTCSKGSLSLYLGTIQGEVDFPKEYALVFSNGRCGRFSVWPIPVDESLDTSLQDRKVKRLELN